MKILVATRLERFLRTNIYFAIITVAVCLLIRILSVPFGGRGPSRTRIAQGDLARIDEAIASYAADHLGAIPCDINDLCRPESGYCYLKEFDRDPWGEPYKYVPLPDIGRYALYSVGPDGVDGNGDDVCLPNDWKRKQ